MGRMKTTPSFNPSFWVSHVFIWVLLLISFPSADAYDPMDPNGNITIKWDIMESHDSSYTALVTIYNFQLYRHVERPGWRLGWAWKEDEVIWKMWGAEATEQGNCSKFSGSEIPHCCEKEPVIVDLLPGAPYNSQYFNCCKGGVLSSSTQDPSNSAASFKLAVGNALITDSALVPPENFTLGVPGYTCGPAYVVPASRYAEDGGRRWTQALATWNVTCSFSQFRASRSPKCCVSFSSFYNSTIVPCPMCSCGCRGKEPSPRCVEHNGDPPLLQLPQSDQPPPPVVKCTRHMCPIRVHWHVKTSYKNYWRVKVTVTNFNYMQSYSGWNLVVQHPNLQSVEQVFSFNYKSLNQYGDINDTMMFWGLQSFNDVLLQLGDNGNVQTEILLRKDLGMFTFEKGWTFPRRISFNGYDCVMPSPEDYPTLTSASPSQSPKYIVYFLPLLLLLLFI